MITDDDIRDRVGPRDEVWPDGRREHPVRPDPERRLKSMSKAVRTLGPVPVVAMTHDRSQSTCRDVAGGFGALMLLASLAVVATEAA